MKEQGLIASTILLTATSLVTRTIGMISIVYISNTIGTEGMGLYQLLMTIYSVGIIVASAGLSVSVSKMIAEEIAKHHFSMISKVMAIALFISALLSITTSFMFFTFTDTIIHLFIADARILWGLKMLSLSIPFISFSSCFKGYFYAVKKAAFPASADILEQFIKLALIMTLVGLWAPKGLSYAYAAVGIGMTIGEMISCSYLLTLYLINRKGVSYPKGKVPFYSTTRKSILFGLIKLILPIALIAYVGSAFISIENILIPMSLRKFGASTEDSLSIYGMLKGMVLPILFFPSAFLTAFSTTLIPEIARANALGHKKRVAYTTNRVIQLTFILSMLIVSIFINYSTEISLIFYKKLEVGQMLKILALIVPFMYIEAVTDGILKGLGIQMCCLRYSIIDSLFRILMIYFLIPIKGISAFIGIMIASNILTSTLNFNKLLDETKIKIKVSNWLIKPSVSATTAGIFSKLLINQIIPTSISLSWHLCLGISLCLMIYIVLLFLVEALTSEDFNWLKKHLSPCKEG
ncbi:hypothetical protein CS063_10540 [Sporanaerobium hydrogeniformans]|uniref:Uncharacterized protein n=1 Tax=Sporanaerobium hydrogeniformans TaxID=3072179 RepID=A0AC61DBA9_9FIRM|nr:MATE family efflux transporter [Sporanaerobium hydrogeniformans]PHV70516.1 hypothetical protein CS063_10540 [Sporanaerobium hydrogeniformans]